MKTQCTMRYITTITLLLLAMIAGAQTISEQFARQLTMPRSYECYRAGGKIKIDGKLNERSWQQAAWTQEFVDISGEGFLKPVKATRAKMLWDNDFFYIAAQIDEDNIESHITQRDAVVWKENDFEVFLDPDGDCRNYFEIEVNARGNVFDLMLDRPYRDGGKFLVQLDGIEPESFIAVHRQGTLNKSSDTDKCWTVEMAIPRKFVTTEFNNPLKAGNTWRVNFSRVQWLKTEGPEENWVWSPTGKVDMHMPERWGLVRLNPAVVGTAGNTAEAVLPASYRLLWAMKYAQDSVKRATGSYYTSVRQFFLSPNEIQDYQVAVDASANYYVLSVTDGGTVHRVSSDGCYSVAPVEKRHVKNWVWTGMRKWSTPDEWKRWFELLKECYIAGVLFEGYDEDIYRACHEAGLEAHYWKWTLNRNELLDSHPEWYAVNRNGERSDTNPAYVDYYRFLCPNQPGLATFLANDYVAELDKPWIDGVHLDYVRMPDVVLPVDLWKNYGIDQSQELAAYDYCYCSVCRDLYKQEFGTDPLAMHYPAQSQTWLNFRLNSVSRVVDSIALAVKRRHGTISAAVFPGPGLARKMVRQDWNHWPLDAFYPMIYNAFYAEGVKWIGQSVAESVEAVDGRAKIYAGLMFNDIKADFVEALDQAFGNGASGVSFFDGPNEEYLYRFKDYIDRKGWIVD